MKTLVSEKDFEAYLNIRKGITIYEHLEAPLDKTFDKITQKIEAKKKHNPYSGWVIGIAASVVLFFGLFTVFSNDSILIETQFGEQKTIALLDGSEVILNSKSKITYDKDNWENSRMLHLEGEAYFKVKKGSTFTVNTNNGSVKVLGTQFNVNSSNDYFQVVCYEGKVSVTNTEGTNVLTPNQNIRKINGNANELWQSNVIEPTWINGESSFRSVPIKYVISALEEHYNIKFNKNNIDDSIVFTGSFAHGNLDVALKTVFNALHITYIEKEKDKIELSTH